MRVVNHFLVGATGGGAAPVLLAALQSTVEAILGGQRPADDLTFLVLRRQA